MYARIRLQPTSSTRIHDALSVRRMPFLLSSRFYIAKEGKMSAYALRRRAPQARCPKCNSPFPTTLPTCNKCSYISDVPSSLQADYFSLFGLPSLVASGSGSSNEEDMNVDARNVFSVDPRELRNRFLQMQKLSHPDRWSQKGPEAAVVAARQSALLNKAYNTLLSPRTRGEYLLSQQGVDILEVDNMEEEQDLMMQVMEAREELEEAEGDEVKELLEANRQRIEKATMELENAIAYENWKEAKRAVIRLRYWESFQRAGKDQDVDH